MNEYQLENDIRRLCDDSGLSNDQIASVLDQLKVGYEMLAEEEEDVE